MGKDITSAAEMLAALQERHSSIKLHLIPVDDIHAAQSRFKSMEKGLKPVPGTM
jgi:hypothetical protein